MAAYYKGKSPYATIAYEVTVDHTRRILACITGHYGPRNDITIVKFYRREYLNSLFKVQVSENEWVAEKGLYLICDGGYHKWRCLQCPLKHALDLDEMNWSEHLESVRKDILQLHSLKDIDATMFTCYVALFIICPLK